MTKIKGFNKRNYISWYNRMVKSEYKLAKNYNCETEKSELLNGCGIEIAGRLTKTGNPILY